MSIGVGLESLIHCRRPTHQVPYYRPASELYVAQNFPRWKRHVTIYEPELKKIGIDQIKDIFLVRNNAAVKIWFRNNKTLILGTEQAILTRDGLRKAKDLQVDEPVAFCKSRLLWYSGVQQTEPISSDLYVITTHKHPCLLIAGCVISTKY